VQAVFRGIFSGVFAVVRSVCGGLFEGIGHSPWRAVADDRKENPRMLFLALG
jgi:hypothetical protein